MTRLKIPHLRNVCELLVGDETVADKTVGSEKAGSGMVRAGLIDKSRMA